MQEDLSEWMVNAPQGRLSINYVAETNAGLPVMIEAIRLEFNKLDFSYIEGIFSDVVLPTTEDLIDISFFDNWVSGGLNLSDPKLKFEIQNSIGLPAQLKLNSAEVTTIENETFELESEILNEGVNFGFPDLSSVGESETTIIEINNTNSNVVEFFNAKPKAINYDVDLLIDADAQELGFYTEESDIQIDAVVELPLLLRANNLVLQDTFDFDEIEYDDIDGTGELMVSLINAFPIGVGINLDFIGDNGNTLFSLINSDEWISIVANLDSALTVDELEAQIISIPISEEHVNMIPSIDKVLVRVLVTTTESFDQDFVWVFDHHGIDVKLGAIIK